MNEKGVQLVIPMAGEGQRFRKQGIFTPKPLIDLGGIRMFELVIANLFTPSVSKIVLISRSEFELEGHGIEIEKKLGIPVKIISVQTTTEGPADSVMLTKDFLSMDSPLVIANSDQYVNLDPGVFYSKLLEEGVSGVILTMEDDDPKWSYVELDSKGEVQRVVEKQVVSNFATVGIYGFKTASSMFAAIEQMRVSNDRVNGEYYVGPCYNYLSNLNGPVSTINLGSVGTAMHGLGTPEDLAGFLGDTKNQVSIQRAVAVMSMKSARVPKPI